MVSARSLARMGILAVGLGIGAAVAATPGIASADSNAVDAAAFDPSPLIADAAPADSGLNLAISIDGFSLIQDGTATATSDTGDIAIAIGNGADAVARLGTGDIAIADGAGSEAEAIDGNNDYASVFGDNGFAQAGIHGNDDVARVFDPTATSSSAGSNAYAILGNDNFASVVGDGDEGRAGGTSADVLGSNDIATIFGTDSTAFSGANATVPGDFDLAAVLGDGLNAHTAIGGDYLVDILPAL
jgi:hypothetical protein